MRGARGRVGRTVRRRSSVVHRWLGLTVAAALVVEFGSGTLLLYRRELAGNGPVGPFWGMLLNLHDCGLACTHLPGHLPVLAAAVPGLGGTTWGGLGLGLLGLALFALALSGMTAWWPPLRRFGRTLRSRLRPKFDRGPFRAHRDLHDLAGPAVLPLLLVWAVAGAVNGFLSAGPGMEPGSGGTGLHSGAFVPWWARTLWAAAGLAALHLVGSGLWTWAWRARRTAGTRRHTPPVIPHQRVGEPSAGANPFGAAVERVAPAGRTSGTGEPGTGAGMIAAASDVAGRAASPVPATTTATVSPARPATYPVLPVMVRPATRRSGHRAAPIAELVVVVPAPVAAGPGGTGGPVRRSQSPWPRRHRRRRRT